MTQFAPIVGWGSPTFDSCVFQEVSSPSLLNKDDLIDLVFIYKGLTLRIPISASAWTAYENYYGAPQKGDIVVKGDIFDRWVQVQYDKLRYSIG